MEIIRTISYERAVKRLHKLGASDADIQRMEEAIARTPGVGDVIPGSSGLRKARFGYGGKGKSGGGRTIYYVLTAAGLVYLLTAYAKADREDISADVLRQFQALVREWTDE